MPNLIERQRRLCEVGIIRTGFKKVNGQGAEYPAALDNFRFTSPNRELLEAVAREHGGEVHPWEGHPGEFEVFTNTNTLKAIISTKSVGGEGDCESLSQWWERWAGNTCTHRCDGEQCRTWRQTGQDRRSKPTFEPEYVECMCDHDDPNLSDLAAKGKACKLTSRLSVILPDVPAIGLWRLNTGSSQFADEVGALIEMIELMGLTGLQYVTLTIEPRQNRTGPGADTEKFNVVRVELDTQPDRNALPRLIQSLQGRPGLGDVQAIEGGPVALPQATGQREISAEERAAMTEKARGEALDYLGAIGLSEPDIETFKEGCVDRGQRWINVALKAKEIGIDNIAALAKFAEDGERP